MTENRGVPASQGPRVIVHCETKGPLFLPYTKTVAASCFGEAASKVKLKVHEHFIRFEWEVPCQT